MKITVSYFVLLFIHLLLLAYIIYGLYAIKPINIPIREGHLLGHCCEHNPLLIDVYKQNEQIIKQNLEIKTLLLKYDNRNKILRGVK